MTPDSLLLNQRIAEQLMQPEAPEPAQSPLAALAARMGKGPQGDVDITMSGPGPRKPGERRRVGDPHPYDPTIVWDGRGWVRSTGMGTQPLRPQPR